MMKILSCIVIFVSGGVVFVNLASLVPTNPNYEASWGKIIVFCLLALVQVFFLKNKY